jgi:uncharacterized protein (TIGR02145 family)
MKTVKLIIALLLLTQIGVFSQGSLTIQGGGAVTVHGSTYIVPAGFTCGSPFIDARDDKEYNTVQIGNQCWMRQDLNYGTRIDAATEQTNNSILEKYCYNNIESNCDLYGGIYQWGELVQYLNGASNSSYWNPVPTGNVQGICPSGWHIPTIDEFSTLMNFLGGEGVAGGKMKEPGTVHWASPNTGATNSSGFTGLPGGMWGPGYFYGQNVYAYYQTISQTSSSTIFIRHLLFDYEFCEPINGPKTYGFPVRCLED